MGPPGRVALSLVLLIHINSFWAYLDELRASEDSSILLLISSLRQQQPILRRVARWDAECVRALLSCEGARIKSVSQTDEPLGKTLVAAM